MLIVIMVLGVMLIVNDVVLMPSLASLVGVGRWDARSYNGC